MKKIIDQLTVASWITILRIVLTPFIVYALINEYWFIGLLIFIFSILTDLLDGFVARYFNQESSFGKLLDPIADKILLSSVMYTLIFISQLEGPVKLCIFFLICKEILLLGGSAFLLWKRNFFIVPSILSRFVSLCEVALVIILMVSKIFSLTDNVLLHGALIVNVFVSSILLLRYLIIIIKK